VNNSNDEPLAEAVATARQKFHCPACGADANWNPAKQALVCPFCGTESPFTLEQRTAETEIVEHDLIAALSQLPAEDRGWQAKKTSVRCQSCRAISVFDPEKVARNCEFCGSAQMVPYEEIEAAFRPESLLPLKIAESQARDLIRAWYGRQWLAPNALGKKALTDTVKGLYLPYWTFDAHAHARWTADSGTYYYTGSGKNRRRNVRWTPASGELAHVFDDELVCASTGVHSGRLKKIEPFPTNELIPYDPGYLAGWVVERYQIDLRGAAERSRQQMEATLRKMCADDVPGDTHRNLQVRSTYTNEHFKHILAPIWLVSYVYHAKSYQVVVNGVTGEIAGERPWSWIKIALLVLVALIVLYIVNS
jgi:Zn finger protein HypA/HybF involved in hydrogenase expression